MKRVRHAPFFCTLLVLGSWAGCGGRPGGTPAPARPRAGAVVTLSEADISMSRLTDPEGEARSGNVKLRFTLTGAGCDLEDVKVAVTVSNEPLNEEGSPPPSFRAVGVTRVWDVWKRPETKDVEISARPANGLRIVSLQGRARAVPLRPGGPAAAAECGLDATWAAR